MEQALWFNLSQMSAFWILLVIWAFFWKGVAMWKAARRNSPGWFVALLLVNTLGIFEIIYLLMTREHCSCGVCEDCRAGSHRILQEDEKEEDEEEEEEVVVVRRRPARR
jgi:hypothetical protein